MVMLIKYLVTKEERFVEQFQAKGRYNLRLNMRLNKKNNIEFVYFF